VASWLLWGASRFGWVPEQTLRQRHGDLLRMSDVLLADMRRMEEAGR
jgi:hypothetical protein